MPKTHRWRWLALLLSLAALGAQTPAPRHPLTFRVTLARELSDHDAGGRMIVLLSSKPPQNGVIDPSGPNGEFIINYKGTVSGDEMKLTVSIPAIDRTFDLTAKRAN